MNNTRVALDITKNTVKAYIKSNSDLSLLGEDLRRTRRKFDDLSAAHIEQLREMIEMQKKAAAAELENAKEAMDLKHQAELMELRLDDTRVLLELAKTEINELQITIGELEGKVELSEELKQEVREAYTTMVENTVEIAALRKALVGLTNDHSKVLAEILVLESENSKDFENAVNLMAKLTDDPKILMAMLSMPDIQKVDAISRLKKAMDAIEMVVAKRNKKLSKVIIDGLEEARKQLIENTLGSCDGEACSLEQWLR